MAKQNTTTAPKQVHVVHQFTSAPETVYDLLIRHETYEAFGLKVLAVHPADNGDRNGVGSSRDLKVRHLPLQRPFTETTTTAQHPHLIRYQITAGSPLRGHWGQLDLAAASDGGTRLIYTIGFTVPIPGATRLAAAIFTAALSRGLRTVCD